MKTVAQSRSQRGFRFKGGYCNWFNIPLRTVYRVSWRLIRLESEIRDVFYFVAISSEMVFSNVFVFNTIMHIYQASLYQQLYILEKEQK